MKPWFDADGAIVDPAKSTTVPDTVNAATVPAEFN